MVEESMPTPSEKPKREQPKFEATKRAHIEIGEGGVLDSIIKAKDFIPWETVTLPSLGLYYEGEIPDGVIEVRPMGMDADKVLATQRLAQSGKSLDYLFKKCARLPGNFSPLSLLAGDRVFLLYYLRGITHGNVYEFVVECPHCSEKNSMEYDLNNLEVIWADENLGEEPFKVVLPKMSEMVDHEVWVKVRMLRGYDLLQMTKEVKKRRKIRPNKRFVEEDVGLVDNMVIDETLSQNLTNLIIEIGSGSEVQTDKNMIAAFVDRLHSSDHAVIREFLNDSSPSVNTNISVDCEHCGEEMTMDLPLTESFFRPQK